MEKKKKDKKNFSRFNVFFISMGLVFAVIIARLLYLQVVMVDEYREQSNRKKYKNVSTVAARGDIIDKNGEVFATSKQSYALMFSETEESKKYFYPTITKVFEILDKKNIPIIDEFPIVFNDGKIEYNFKATDKESKRWMELRFKKDRGFEEEVINKNFSGKKSDDLTESQKKQVDELLLQISAEDALKKLIKDYGIDSYYELSMEEQRKYLIVKDNIAIQRFTGYAPVTISNNLDKETAFEFEQLQPNLPGITVDTQPIRFYPNDDLGSSFLGYMSKINSWEKEKYEEKGYDISSDYVGTAGIESAFEEYLKGIKGQESIEINKQGRKVKTLGEVESYAGKTVQLNIDMDLQRVAEQALDDTMKELQKRGKEQFTDSTNATRGAAVVLNAKTGEVLSLVSRPGYDPNVFAIPGKLTPELSQEYFNTDLEKMGLEYIKKRGLANKSGVLTEKQLSTLNYDERLKLVLNELFPIDKSTEGSTKSREDKYDIFPKPLYNYATLSLVPPGSTFKPVTAIAGLEEGVINGSTLIRDSGPYNKRYSDYKGACWIYNQRKGSHGSINVSGALGVSCNYFFYDVADRLYDKTGGTTEALDFIAEYAWKLGLGVPTGSDIEASTGIEISENFGQVYNYESSKKSLTIQYVSTLVEYLNAGISSMNPVKHYQPFDITQQEEKGNAKEIEQIRVSNDKKKILVDSIKDEMKADKRKPEGEMLSLLQKLIKDVIDSNESLKAKNYTTKDIKNVALTMYYSINDARTYINSAANAYDAAIGQGQNYFTPLQLASYIATLVNGGNRYELQLVDKIIDSATGEVIEDFQPKLIDKVDFDEKNIELVKKGMKDVTQGESGTAASVFKNFPISNGGKTGTSDIINENYYDATGRAAAGVYLGFAPYDDPEIVVCSIIFDGSQNSGAVAKAIFEEYFKEEIKKINPSYKFKYENLKKEEETINNSTEGNESLQNQQR